MQVIKNTSDFFPAKLCLCLYPWPTCGLKLYCTSVTFISRLNALDYAKLRSQNLRCTKILKDIKLKITPHVSDRMRSIIREYKVVLD